MFFKKCYYDNCFIAVCSSWIYSLGQAELNAADIIFLTHLDILYVGIDNIE